MKRTCEWRGTSLPNPDSTCHSSHPTCCRVVICCCSCRYSCTFRCRCSNISCPARGSSSGGRWKPGVGVRPAWWRTDAGGGGGGGGGGNGSVRAVGVVMTTVLGRVAVRDTRKSPLCAVPGVSRVAGGRGSGQGARCHSGSSRWAGSIPGPRRVCACVPTTTAQPCVSADDRQPTLAFPPHYLRLHGAAPPAPSCSPCRPSPLDPLLPSRATNKCQDRDVISGVTFKWTRDYCLRQAQQEAAGPPLSPRRCNFLLLALLYSPPLLHLRLR
ncbi:hypothetical protein O3P69_011525 [Scylla paramamosain]|uniref:Uncharacterized protein n=1 Tax=Scylla paramamosain TaxID=85552 RepID=A0AAW0T9L3_SCYPA